ncbi:phosphate starvation protein PhoH [Clostridia bacterium]|nr:phosphate starvation protein PhoH [Clostridia bacterium]
MAERSLKPESPDKLTAFFGELDKNSSLLEKEFNVSIRNRDDKILITGDDYNVSKAGEAASFLLNLLEFSENLTEQNIAYAAGMVKDNKAAELKGLEGDSVCVTSRGKPIKAKTIGQKTYCDAIKKNTVTFGVGPAGTGKTFLAVALAVTALKAKKVQRIILTRPAVEAGEKLGFLPGDLQNKIDPYLRPLYDALYEMLTFDGYTRLAEKGVIEIAPLAYMRGRTLDDSFIILDEAQNTTPAQMKMFLTRLGFNSKAVVTGDITQIDLPRDSKSGLVEAVKILRNIDDIAIINFSERDVVRHSLVRKIIAAYEKHETRLVHSHVNPVLSDTHKRRIALRKK